MAANGQSHIRCAPLRGPLFSCGYECICMSILASCVTSIPGDAFLERCSVLKSPTVPLTTWERKKKQPHPGSKCFPCFFNLPSEPHHRLNESCTCNNPAVLFLLLTAECDTPGESPVDNVSCLGRFLLCCSITR